MSATTATSPAQAAEVQNEPEPAATEDRVEIDYEAAVRRFPKLVQLTGDPALFPPKARKVLGQDDGLSPEARRAMSKHDAEQARRDEQARKERVEEISRLLPTPEQLALPIPGRRVSDKALRFFGDDALAEASRRVVTEEERRNATRHPKLVKVLGEPALVSSGKVLRRLGSEMRIGQRKAQARAERAEQAKRRNEMRRKLAEALRALPTEEQLQLPPKARARPVSDKALRFFGDDRLNEMACRVVTPEMRRNVCPKTLRFFGETDLLSDKQRQLLGDLGGPPAAPQRGHGSWVSGLVHKFFPIAA